LVQAHGSLTWTIDGIDHHVLAEGLHYHQSVELEAVTTLDHMF